MARATISAADPPEMMEIFQERGWTDGLPVVPPTPDLVDAFIAAAGREESEVVLRVAEARREVTVGTAAINSVMAGCRPEYFPVVLAALEGWGDPRWGDGVRGKFYYGLASTGGGGQLQIVNGPVRQELGMNSGVSVYGPGNRANATIGRALRLIIINGLGMHAGELEMGTQGHPGKYSFCIAENEEESPWEPLHVEHGFAPTASTVLTMSARGPEPIENRHSNVPEEILLTIADTMSRLGGSLAWPVRPGQPIVVVMGPEHAQKIAAKGWAKQDVKAFLAEHSRRPLADIVRVGTRPPGGNVSDVDEAGFVSAVHGADEVHLVVAGGNNAGVSSVITGWAHTTPPGQPIITPVRSGSASQITQANGGK